MKKLCVLLMLGILFLSFSAELKAEDGCAKEKGVDFFVNVGAITDDSFSFDPFLWYLGTNLDIHFGKYLMLSPEVDVVTYKFKFDTFWLQPAVLLNVKLRCFFVGAGIGKYFLISGDDYVSTDVHLKLNAGFRGKHVRVRIFADMDFDSLFKDMLLGFQIGIGF